MTLELAAVPQAFMAGIGGVLSPCVWPRVPVVTSATSTSGGSGPIWLALGLSLSFAVAGTALTFVLVRSGLDPELFRYLAAVLLVGAALLLLVTGAGRRSGTGSLGERREAGGGCMGLEGSGQRLSGRSVRSVRDECPPEGGRLPCVGPTLGVAVALASMGQSLPVAFVVTLA